MLCNSVVTVIVIVLLADNHEKINSWVHGCIGLERSKWDS